MEFNDEFESDELDNANWLPFYTPVCCANGIALPIYEIRKGNLALKITEEQVSWFPEFDEDFKGSSFQTGIYSGIKDDAIGLHTNGCLSETFPVNHFKNTYVPQFVFFEIRAIVLISKSNLVSFRLRGYDKEQMKSAEIYIFEIKGNSLKGEMVKVGYGIRKFHDKKLKEEFYESTVDIDVSRFHCYAVE